MLKQRSLEHLFRTICNSWPSSASTSASCIDFHTRSGHHRLIQSGLPLGFRYFSRGFTAAGTSEGAGAGLVRVDLTSAHPTASEGRLLVTQLAAAGETRSEEQACRNSAAALMAIAAASLRLQASQVQLPSSPSSQAIASGLLETSRLGFCSPSSASLAVPDSCSWNEVWQGHRQQQSPCFRRTGRVRCFVARSPNTSSPWDEPGSRRDLTHYYDYVVIGSGVAGLRYSLEVAKHGSVAIVTKSEPHESNTNYAQGGVSAVLDPADSVENHIRDTMVAGAFLCDEETVEVVCREGPERVRELMEMGASFDHSEDGQLHLAREGGHSHHRIVHSADMTGREIERALLTAVRSNPNITMFEHHFGLDLLTRQDGADVTCCGLDALDSRSKAVVRFMAGVTMLASGGAGHIYPSTTNPLVATGDGVALAHRAHAVVSNMEFVQFHPTALADEGLPVRPSRDNAFLITEAVRGAGGVLYNQAMERFMPLYDPRAELAPRDVVARSIDDQLKKRGEKFVYLDISHKPAQEILSHFPNIAAECLKYGLDITQQPIPVVPAAHYMCGGIQTGLSGETSIKGLYAAGEVTCTGLHGANRLASNSLLEALVFAQRAVEPSIAYVQQKLKSDSLTDEDRNAQEWPRPVAAVRSAYPCLADVVQFTSEKRKELQKIMWNYVGIVRSTERLKIAQRELLELEVDWEAYLCQKGWKPSMVSLEVCEMRNLISVSHLVVNSALARQESRGLHYTVDFPHLVESERLPTVVFPSSPVLLTWSSQQLHRSSEVKLCHVPITND